MKTEKITIYGHEIVFEGFLLGGEIRVLGEAAQGGENLAGVEFLQKLAARSITLRTGKSVTVDDLDREPFTPETMQGIMRLVEAGTEALAPKKAGRGQASR